MMRGRGGRKKGGEREREERGDGRARGEKGEGGEKK